MSGLSAASSVLQGCYTARFRWIISLGVWKSGYVLLLFNLRTWMFYTCLNLCVDVGAINCLFCSTRLSPDSEGLSAFEYESRVMCYSIRVHGGFTPAINLWVEVEAISCLCCSTRLLYRQILKDYQPWSMKVGLCAIQLAYMDVSHL